MVVKGLLGEFLHETENTRKLLKAIPDEILSWKPSEISWTTAELASHIATIYYWYIGVFSTDTFDMEALIYDREDISKMESIRERFEENVLIAQDMLENARDEDMFLQWKMVHGEKEIIPSMPRIMAVRGFLMNHLYHHRGEMIVYLRSTGNKVPGLFGPVAETSLS